MKESVKIDAALVEKVRERVTKTKQTIGGFFELAAVQAMSRKKRLDPAEFKRLEDKAKKWDALADTISKFYGDEGESGDLVDIGEQAAMAFGFL